MSPDRDPDRALRLSRGLFGQPRPDRPDPQEPDRKDDPAPGSLDSNP
ncbi:MAG TPA: hypothetical protein VGO55_06665 [Allosphingosinicella sp.]|jgi:hypothetical protein|nr:hypothetical protein [Allosphingosinicella sp.]